MFFLGNKVISGGNIVVNGTVQGIDLSKEAVLSENTKTQEIFGHKTFSKNITVTGRILHISGNISGISVSAFCQAVVSSSSHLHIVGKRSS